MAPDSLPKSEEILVVVPVEALRAAGLEEGFRGNVAPILEAAFRPGAAQPLARSLAEGDERYKQLVCYIVLLYGCEIYNYRRSARGGESRLVGLRSVGIGGHLNVADGSQLDGRPGLERGIRRELAEEVQISEDPDFDIVGVINDDSTPVGRVHLGLVAVARLHSPAIDLRDPGLVDGRFDSLETLIAGQAEFETWSRLCLPALAGLIPRHLLQ